MFPALEWHHYPFLWYSGLPWCQGKSDSRMSERRLKVTDSSYSYRHVFHARLIVRLTYVFTDNFQHQSQVTGKVEVCGQTNRQTNERTLSNKTQFVPITRSGDIKMLCPVTPLEQISVSCNEWVFARETPFKQPTATLLRVYCNIQELNYNNFILF